MGIRRFWVVTLVASTALAAGAGPARAASTSIAGGAGPVRAASTTGLASAGLIRRSVAVAPGYEVAYWPMNERAGARVMHDGSGHGLNGRIGAEVGTGGGYTFDRLDPDTPPPHPRHLVVVPDHAALDPGARTFRVTLRLRTIYHFGNVIQKGQATVPGGSWKIQIPSGHVQCWFRGSAGEVLVTATRAVNDGRWHTISCTRYPDGVTLTVDGSTVAGKWGRTGTIANSWPLSIGGKTVCNQRSVGCDYYAGELASVRIDASDSW